MGKAGRKMGVWERVGRAKRDNWEIGMGVPRV